MPLALIGVTAGLLLFDQPFGFMALLGALALSGMLIKNAIVLIDQINLNLAGGMTPYDAIIVTAAPVAIPPALVRQLAPGGRMVVPVGEYPGIQELVVVKKDADGSIRERGVLPVAFVPLVS